MNADRDQLDRAHKKITAAHDELRGLSWEDRMARVAAAVDAGKCRDCIHSEQGPTAHAIRSNRCDDCQADRDRHYEEKCAAEVYD